MPITIESTPVIQPTYKAYNITNHQAMHVNQLQLMPMNVANGKKTYSQATCEASNDAIIDNQTIEPKKKVT